MRRRLLRILLIAAIALVVLVLTVQIVLWTVVPRRLVISQLESKLGLRMTSSSLSTGWFGRTTLRDVTLSLPLAEHPFARVPRLKVTHDWLIWLLLTRAVDITGMDLDHPQLQVVQEPNGRWNLQDVMDLLVRNTSKSKSDSSSKTRLPRLHVVEATLTITDRSGRSLAVKPVNFDGDADSALSWHYDLQIPKHVAISGRLAPGDVWEHTAELHVNDVASWIAPWGKIPDGLAIDGAWTGQVNAGQVSGRLELANLTCNDGHLSGAVDIRGQAQTFELRPDKLKVRTHFSSLEEVAVASGVISLDKNVLRAQGLQLLAYGGPATLGGWYDLGTHAGQVQAAWDKLLLGKDIRHGGTLTANLRRPFPGQFALDGALTSFGTTTKGPWRGAVNFNATLDAALAGSWHVEAPELRWNRRDPVRLDGLKLAGAFVHEAHPLPTITLDSVAPADETQLHGSGRYQLSDHSWTLRLNGQQWPFHPLEEQELAFDLDVGGTRELIELRNFALHNTDGEVTAHGNYQFGRPKPLHLTLKLDNHPTGSAVDPRLLLQGFVDGQADLDGTVDPRNISLTGTLHGADVKLAGRLVGDLAIQVTGTIDAKQADVRTEQLMALGGNWGLKGIYDFDQGFLDVGVHVKDQPLENLAAVAQTSPLTGRLNGEWDAYTYGLKLDLNRLRLSGGGTIRDLHARSIAVDEVKFSTTMGQGELRVTPIVFSRGPTGRGRAAGVWRASEPGHLETNQIVIDSWPIDIGQLGVSASVDIPQAAIDLLRQATATAPAQPLEILAPSIHANGQIALRGKPVSDFSLSSRIAGRVLRIDALNANPLGGSIDGSAVVNLDRPLEAEGAFTFYHIDAARIADSVPQLNGIEGTIHGSAHLRPAQTPRPLEPLTLGMTAIWDRGHFRTVPIRQIDLNLFTNGTRFVLDDRTGHDSTIAMADGMVRVWGRVTRRPNDLLALQSQIHLEDLNLDEIVHAANGSARPSPGRVSGNILLLYDTSPRQEPPEGTADGSNSVASRQPATRAIDPAFKRLVQSVYGEASLNLTQSSIAALPITSNLFDLMSLGQNDRGPTGNGSIDAHLENGQFDVRHLRFFNKGIEVRGVLTSPEMWNFPDNPVRATAVGTLQPLAALKLPFAADLQGALTALQPDLSTVATDPTATWRNLTEHVHPVPFLSAGKDIRAFIFGDISGTSAGQ